MKIFFVLRNILAYLLGIPYLLVAGPLCLAIAALPERWRMSNRLFFWLTYGFFWLALKLTWLPITICGHEHVPAGYAIFTGNHQSSLDIPLLGIVAGSRPAVWFLMQELLDYPVFGFILRRMFVAVDRSTPRNGAKALLRGLKQLEAYPANIMIFPEGHRSAGVTVDSFLDGFVMLARRTGLPVVPVKMYGVHEAFPPGSWFVRYHPIEVHIGPSVTYNDQDSDETFSRRVHAWFLEDHCSNRSE